MTIGPHRFLTVLALAAGLAFVVPSTARAKDKQEPAAVAAFKTAYNSDDAKVRGEAVSALSKAKDDEKFTILSTLVIPKEDRADVISRAVDVLARIEDKAIQDQVAKLAARGKLDERLVYLEALSGYSHSEAGHAALLAAVSDKDAFVRGMAAFGLGAHRNLDAIEPLMKLLLDDPAWQVQATVLDALPRLDARSALDAKVPAIIEFMEGASGRIRDDVGNALRRITGKNFGRDPEKWRAWLDGKEAKEDPVEGDGESVPAPESTAYGNQAGKPHFYGIEVTSERVVILLDVSLSMNDAITIDMERLKRETSRKRAITGGGADPKDDKGEPQEFDIPWWRVKTNLDLARYQTINLIEKLQPEQSFELILFSTKVKPWMGRLVPATAANKLKAQRLVEEIVPEDKTNTWGALAAAFDLYDNQARSYKDGPDALYMVTDGEPSIGDIIDLDAIETAVLQLWKVKQIRINIIGIGVNLRGLRRIATRTGGKAKFFN
jgi:hypothetical protein